MFRLIIAAACLCVLFGGAELWAVVDKIDDTREVVEAYNRGSVLLQKSDWVGAATQFRELIARNPQSKNLDIFLYNAGRADYHQGAYAEASAAFEKLVTQFPESGLRAYGEYFLAGSRYALSNVEGAIVSWVDAWRDACEERLQKLIVSSLAGALNTATEVELARELFDKLSDEQRCLLSRQILKNIPESKQKLRGQLSEYCGDKVPLPATTATKSSTNNSEYKIAIMLPFSGGFESFAQQIMQGATVASEEAALTHGIDLTLVAFDTKGDPITAARLVTPIDSSGALAAIGPLTSDEAAVVSATLGGSSLPVLIPAATDAGLTTLSQTSFQLSANVELQGVAMAEYAVGTLNADSAAIMTAGESNYQPIVQSFVRRFEKLGGKVIATELYRTRDRDFGPYLTDLKGMILGYQPDTIWYINAKGDTLDPEGVPVHIDCLYLPGDPAQLRQILPQLRFYGIDAALLGSDGWGDTLIYRMGDDVTRQAVFPSPFIIHENTEQFVTFSAAFQKRIGLKPSRLACLGYDAVKLIVDGILSGANTREALVKYLSLRHDYSGAAGTISFGNIRENTAMPLYRVQSGQALPLETSTLSPKR